MVHQQSYRVAGYLAVHRTHTKRLSWFVVSWLVCCGAACAGCDPDEASSSRESANAEPERIDTRVSDPPTALYFYDAGCPDCELVEREVLPQLLGAHGLAPRDLQRLDVGRRENVARLLALEDRLGFKADSLAPVLVLDGTAYAGVDAIAGLLENR